MNASTNDIGAWADAYIAAQSSGHLLDAGDPDWWAVERFMQPRTLEETEAGWLAILEVLAREPARQVLDALAAGPLEDLIHYWGPAFVDRIEEEAHSNDAFRALLDRVWESSTPEVWTRVARAARGPEGSES